MQILAGEEAVAQHRVARDVRQDAQLDLAVVRAQEPPARPRNERLADFRAERRADGDVLQIGIDRRQTPGRGHRLIEGRVQAPVLAERRRQRIEVRRLELHQLAVLEHFRGQRVLLRQLFEHFLIGGRTRLAALQDWELQLLVQDFGELLIRRRQEFLTGQIGDLAEQLVDLQTQVAVQRFEARHVERDAGELHAREHLLERQLQLGV